MHAHENIQEKQSGYDLLFTAVCVGYQRVPPPLSDLNGPVSMKIL